MAPRLISNGRALLRRLTVIEGLSVGDAAGTFAVEQDVVTVTDAVMTMQDSDLYVVGGAVNSDGGFFGHTAALGAFVDAPSGGATVDAEARTAIVGILLALADLGVIEALPYPPTGLAVTNGDTEATVAFTPGNAGGGTISDYEYRVDAGSWTSAATDVSPVTVTGLTNDVEVQITLRAVNEFGTGSASAAVAATPTAP